MCMVNAYASPMPNLICKNTVYTILSLNFAVEVEAAIPNINASEGSSPVLSCEMKGYIHPDSDFQWRRGDDIIISTDEHRITYVEGFIDKARNGGSDLVSSRTTSLRIIEVDVSDAGQYTCFVLGTDSADNVQLRIEEPGTICALRDPMECPNSESTS